VPKLIGCWILVLVVGCFTRAFCQSENLDNKDKSFTIIKNDTVNTSGIPVLKYKVMRNADKRVVIEGSITMGGIEWSADYELTEFRSLGTAQPIENQQSRRIDVRPYIIKTKN
jgi:hypothetical protein